MAATGVQGGLIVHVGCGDGQLTALLADRDSCLVHALDPQRENVARTRDRLKLLGLQHRASVASWNGTSLPYVDNLVSLLIVEDARRVSSAEMMRVLRPLGAVCTRDDGRWVVTKKPWPSAIDEWTHFLHGPDNNATASDREVGSPHHMQWIGDPKWARHHNYLSSTSAMVSARGRLFAILDEGPTESIDLAPQWALVARDGFSGVLLWKHRIRDWEGHLRPFRSGPPELSRRLVAVENQVYVTLGYGRPLSKLDAATGEVLQTYDGTDGAVELICDEGVIYVVVGSLDQAQYAETRRRGEASPTPRGKRLMALQAHSGEILWTADDRDTHAMLGSTLCVGGGRLFYQGVDHIVCRDAASGEIQWQVSQSSRRRRLGWSAPTMVFQEGVLLCADVATVAKDDASSEIQWDVTANPGTTDGHLGALTARSAETGEELWSCPSAQGYNSPMDVFVADGLVWTSTVPKLTSADFTEGRDLLTGGIKRRLTTEAAFTETHHHRCYRNKATDRFILLGRTGTELIDLAGETPVRHNWVRGACQYGVLPCNGLLYAPSHSCACYIQSKLSGLLALAPRRGDTLALATAQSQDRLEPGKAAPATQAVASQVDSARDWPTYRHDAGRSGRTSAKIDGPVMVKWRTRLSAPLTSPVAQDGVLLVASIDARELHAMDAATGSHLWIKQVGGRIDSPPTIYRGLALFGCADGYVYCLRLRDGELVWRFRAAPVDLRCVAFDQVESVWPVTGSVLVRDGVVYCTAGRSSYLDGGMHLIRLDPATGKLLGSKRFYQRDLQTGEQPESLVDDVEMPGALPDVLSAVGADVFWRDMRLNEEGKQLESNVPHMYSTVGFLDDSWWHRTYWIYGAVTYGRASGWAVVGNYVPSGRLMVEDEETIFGFGRRVVSGGDRGLTDARFHLFRADKQVRTGDPARRLNNNNKALAREFVPTEVSYHWSREAPILVRAMLLADKTLFAAGPTVESLGPTSGSAFEADRDSLLVAVSAGEGEVVNRYELPAQPVFDGLIAAGNRLYLSLKDGSVLCMASEGTGAE